MAQLTAAQQFLLETYGSADPRAMYNADYSNVASEIPGYEGTLVTDLMAEAMQNSPGASAVGNTAAAMTNPVPLAIIPTDASMGAILAALTEFRFRKYGSTELGEVRRVSNVGIVNEQSGVRPGALPRIVLPIGARKERGYPT